MSKSYMSAPDADRIAAELLSDVHDHLADFPVRCIFQDEADKKGGRVVYANIRKLSGLHAFLAGSVPVEGLQDSLDLDMPITFQPGAELLLIVVAEDRWRDLDAAQRVALIDHELCHARIVEDEKTGERKVVLVGHDVEEFHAVIQRHGDWLGQIAPFAEAPDESADAVVTRAIFGGTKHAAPHARKAEPLEDEVADEDGTRYGGKLTPVYAGDHSENIVSCTLEIRRKGPDDEAASLMVEGREFDTVQMAWEFFDSLTGCGSVLAWAGRQALESSADFIAVDELTLDAIATALGVGLPGDRLEVQTAIGQRMFIARPDGKRAPMAQAEKAKSTRKGKRAAGD